MQPLILYLFKLILCQGGFNDCAELLIDAKADVEVHVEILLLLLFHFKR